MTLAGPCAALVGILAEPVRAASATPAQWTQLLAVARATNLVGSLAERLHRSGIALQPPVARHLEGARQLAARQRLSVTWEAHALNDALGELAVPVVLLKGAAYAMAGLDTAAGRMFGDIDLLVPHEALGRVEGALMLNGWFSAKSDAYDQRYYREWMHELPPMAHVRSGAVVDVHHTILPPTARHSPDPARIVARSSPVSGLPALRVPCVEDLLIHSITHLVHEGELNNGLRDLVDIDSMLRASSSQPGFWGRFAEAAVEHDLVEPVCFGLRLVQRVLDTPVPADVARSLASRARGRMPWRSLDSVYERALQQAVPGGGGARAELAALLIYIRAHWLRMPPGLLLRHLAMKAWMGLRDPVRPRTDDA
jgi:hypothetical protein